MAYFEKEILFVGKSFSAYKIIRNGKCLFDDDYEKLENNKKFISSYRNFFTHLGRYCDGDSTPKIKKIEGRNKGDGAIEYEFILSDYRFYLFHYNEETIFVYIELKDTKKQKRTIKRLRKIKNDYISFIESENKDD